MDVCRKKRMLDGLVSTYCNLIPYSRKKIYSTDTRGQDKEKFGDKKSEEYFCNNVNNDTSRLERTIGVLFDILYLPVAAPGFEPLLPPVQGQLCDAVSPYFCNAEPFNTFSIDI
jgi:hypothetical protein